MRLFILFVSFGCLLLTVYIPSAAQTLGTPVALSANSGSTTGQLDKFGRPAPDSRGWTDPALNHNKLLIEEGGYQLIGTYKVKGSQFLFGQRHKGDIFSASEKGYNIYISYNTYNQEVEFYSTANPDKSLVKEPGTLDSFIFHPDTSLGILHPLKFVYGSLLGTKDKSWYEEIYVGSRFSLYKKYKSDLGYDGNNIAQSELRRFDLGYEYYYTDTGNKGVKKLKPNAGSVIKEFKDVKDLSSMVNNDDFTANPEEALRKAFNYLDN